jgi:uncharacterized protein YqeY
MAEPQNGSSLADRVDVDLVSAMRRREATVLNTLRLLKTAAKNAEVAKRRQLSDEEYVAVVRQQVKMRRDAASEYDKAGRAELADQERAESAVLEVYLPVQLDADAVRVVVLAALDETGATGPGDMGKVMSVAMRELRGKADGALVNATVRSLLAERSS